jgi:hypothetical protein
VVVQGIVKLQPEFGIWICILVIHPRGYLDWRAKVGVLLIETKLSEFPPLLETDVGDGPSQGGSRLFCFG